MGISKDFEIWLINNKRKKNGSKLSVSSAYKYTRAIESISKDMIKAGVLDRSLFNFTSAHDLKRIIVGIKGNKHFNLKNETGHNMYSVALDHYLDFIKDL